MRKGETMNKLFMFIMMMLTSITLVSATLYVESINTDLPSSVNSDQKSGWFVRAKYDSELVDITKDSATTSTRALVYDENATLIDTASFSGNVATFSTPVILSQNGIYIFEIDENGNSYDISYNSNLFVPFDTTTLTFLNSSGNEVPNVWSFPPTNFTINTSANITCTEDWIQANTSCNGYNYTVEYYDNNICGTTLNLPIDNGTIVACSFPPIVRAQVNITTCGDYTDSNTDYVVDTAMTTGYLCLRFGTSAIPNVENITISCNNMNPINIGGGNEFIQLGGAIISGYPTINNVEVFNCNLTNGNTAIYMHSGSDAYNDHTFTNIRIHDIDFKNNLKSVSFYGDFAFGSGTSQDNLTNFELYNVNVQCKIPSGIPNWNSSALMVEGYNNILNLNNVSFHDSTINCKNPDGIFYDISACTLNGAVSSNNIINNYVCAENWIANNTACNGFNYTIGYYDSNACGTFTNLPIDNGNIISCETVPIDITGMVSRTNTALVNMMVALIIVGLVVGIGGFLGAKFGLLEDKTAFWIMASAMVGLTLIILVLSLKMLNIV